MSAEGQDVVWDAEVVLVALDVGDSNGLWLGAALVLDVNLEVEWCLAIQCDWDHIISGVLILAVLVSLTELGECSSRLGVDSLLDEKRNILSRIIVVSIIGKVAEVISLQPGLGRVQWNDDASESSIDLLDVDRLGANVRLVVVLVLKMVWWRTWKLLLA